MFSYFRQEVVYGFCQDNNPTETIRWRSKMPFYFIFQKRRFYNVCSQSKICTKQLQIVSIKDNKIKYNKKEINQLYFSISTLSDKLLKLIDQFTYLGSYISSTESDINICIMETWTVINRLSVIWKSDLSNQIELDFLQAVSVLLCGCTT